MRSNNEYHANVRKRKIEGLSNIYQERTTSNGEISTIQDWMQKYTCVSNRNEQLFERVEKNVFGETTIIFNYSKIDEVNQFLSEFTELLRSKFPEGSDELNENIKVPLISTESTKRASYAQILRNHYQSGDMDTKHENFPISPPSTSRFYYGSAQGIIKESYVNHMTKERIEMNESNNEKNEEVMKVVENEVVKRLDEITAKQLALEEKLQTRIEEIMTKEIESVDIEKTEEKLESMMDEKIQSLEKSIDTKLNEMQDRHAGEIDRVFNTFERQLQNAVETQESLLQSMQDQMRLTMSKQVIIQQRQHNEMLNEVKRSIVNTMTSVSQSPPEVATSSVKNEHEEESGEMPQ